MKFGVIVFPGSNCDHDAHYSSAQSTGSESVYLWHKDTSIPSDIDCIIVPGGFSYGDYLRCGAVARFSPIMREVVNFANKGGHVLGICNGFQILTESGLLPGTLMRNKTLTFLCKDVYLRVENTNSAFTSSLQKNDILRIPIAHGEGNYFADQNTLASLEENGQIAFRYASANGELSEESNPNGSIEFIAGITNKNKNVLGMMPHPDRSSDSLLGYVDGAKIYQSLASHLSK